MSTSANPTRTPAETIITYLTDVVQGGQLDLIEDLAQPDMVDEANQAFGGPPGRAGLVAHLTTAASAATGCGCTPRCRRPWCSTR